MEVIKKELQVKEVEVIIESYNLCDKCNQEIETENYEDFQCDVIHRSGNRYPDSSYGTTEKVELCQKCAIDLIILLKENGYRVEKSEYDY